MRTCTVGSAALVVMALLAAQACTPDSPAVLASPSPITPSGPPEHDRILPACQLVRPETVQRLAPDDEPRSSSEDRRCEWSSHAVAARDSRILSVVTAAWRSGLDLSGAEAARRDFSFSLQWSTDSIGGLQRPLSGFADEARLGYGFSDERRFARLVVRSRNLIVMVTYEAAAQVLSDRYRALPLADLAAGAQAAARDALARFGVIPAPAATPPPDRGMVTTAPAVCPAVTSRFVAGIAARDLTPATGRLRSACQWSDRGRDVSAEAEVMTGGDGSGRSATDLAREVTVAARLDKPVQPVPGLGDEAFARMDTDADRTVVARLRNLVVVTTCSQVPDAEACARAIAAEVLAHVG
jgi:hypothetical protein